MAAGVGSRYGGFKQIDPVGPGGETIIDYSVFDAVRAGFGKAVFVIRRDIADAFKEKIIARFEKKISCAVVFQELGSGLGAFDPPSGRTKPWGTGHAVLAAENEIDEPFAVANADDFYGANTFGIMADFLSADGPASETSYAMAGYVLRNTLSDHGYVSRGICERDETGRLKKIVERVRVFKDGTAAYYLDENDTKHPLTGDETVSMNFWGFRPSLFGHLKRLFEEFLGERGRDIESEFYIPHAVDELIARNQAGVDILPTEEAWFGVTYHEDRDATKARIRRMIEKGVYPERLWA